METVFFKPENMQSAFSVLEQYGNSAMIVNGGTDAVLHLVEKKQSPQAIVHIAGLPGFHEITAAEDSVRLGGAVTYREMLSSPVLQPYTGLMEAIRHLASPAIRAIATPAGNLCTAAPSADCTTMLMALRAKVRLESSRGERTVPVEAFFTGTYRTVRQPDELMTCIEIPALKSGDGTGYCRLSRRKAQDIGKVLVGAWVRVEKDTIVDVSIGLGALNAYAVRATELEQALIGKSCDEALTYVSTNFPKEATLRESYFKAYKLDVTCAAVERALEMAIKAAKGETA